MGDGIVECLFESNFIVDRYSQVRQCRQFVQFVEHCHLIDDEISVQIQFDEIFENVETRVRITVRQLNAFDMIRDAKEDLQCVQVAQFQHFVEVVQRIALQIEKFKRFEDPGGVRDTQGANGILGYRQLLDVWPESCNVQQIRPLPDVASTQIDIFEMAKMRLQFIDFGFSWQSQAITAIKFRKEKNKYGIR